MVTIRCLLSVGISRWKNGFILFVMACLGPLDHFAHGERANSPNTGLQITHHSNGQKAEETEWVKGRMTRQTFWYPDGQKKFEAIWNDGDHLRSTSFAPNGNKTYEEERGKDFPTYWDADGQPLTGRWDLSTSEGRPFTGIVAHYDVQNRKHELEFLHGKRIRQSAWYPDGTKAEEQIYQKGKAVLNTRWDKRGQLQSETSYSHGLPARQRTWHSNGERGESEYGFSTRGDPNGLHPIRIQLWAADGQPYNGSRDTSDTFRHRGETVYRDGLRSIETFRYENGQRLRETVFQDGYAARTTEWHPNGQQSQEMEYERGSMTRVTRWNEQGEFLDEKVFGARGPQSIDRRSAPSPAWLGLLAEPATPTEARQFGLTKALKIKTVEAKSPAETAELQPGDLLIKVEGRPVDNEASLTLIIESFFSGSRVKLEIGRSGKVLIRFATLVPAPMRDNPRRRSP